MEATRTRTVTEITVEQLHSYEGAMCQACATGTLQRQPSVDPVDGRGVILRCTNTARCDCRISIKP